MEEDDPVMKMYEAQAIVIEKDGEIDELKREKEELQRQLQQLRLQGAASSSNQDVWKAIRAIQERFEPLENTDRLDRIEIKLEEMAANMAAMRIERKPAINKRRDAVRPAQEPGQETILLMGGGSNTSTNEILILNKNRTGWMPLLLKLPCKTWNSGAAYLNDTLYVFGGFGLLDKLYKLGRQKKWTEMANMNQKRNNIISSSLVFQGCIWVFGGENKNCADVLNSAEKYCPEINKWIKLPDMNVARSLCAAAVCNAKIFVCGGRTMKQSRLVNVYSVECFDPEASVWTTVLTDYSFTPHSLSMVSYRRRLIAIGGEHPDSYNEQDNSRNVMALSPDVANVVWLRLAPMKASRVNHAAVVLGNEIFAIGGWNSKGSMDSVEIFNGECWREGPALPNEMTGQAAVVIPPSFADVMYRCQK